ncbi:MAG: leucine-rich repeat domain-containing protein [Lachnospiraceae bacterium]|nr:leucine-rich repeat domain-containing protein [Lachnospiraceae bacterium]
METKKKITKLQIVREVLVVVALCASYLIGRYGTVNTGGQNPCPEVDGGMKTDLEEDAQDGTAANGDTPDGGDAEDGLICGDYRYEIVHGENAVRILAYLGDEEIVFVPEKLDGMEVTVIGSGAFSGKSVMEQVLLSSGVKEIEEEAFAYCSRLQYIIMGDQVSSIGTEAFAYCPSLEEIRFPKELDRIGYRICAYCPRLEKIYFPRDMEDIGAPHFEFYSAFEGCHELKLAYGNSPYAEAYAEVLGLVYVDLNRIEEEGNLVW